jgi:hypothetical protein
LGSGADQDYAFTSVPGDRYSVRFNGQIVEVTYSDGPDRSEWEVYVDGARLIDDDEPFVIDGYNRAERFEVTTEIDTGEPGEHELVIVNTAVRDDDSTGTVMALAGVEVLPAPRVSNLGIILGLLVAVQALGLLLSWVFGRRSFRGIAETMSTKRTLVLALVVYAAISVWGFFLDSVIEFWFLAWMVATVQGGSQALSRSLYAGMSPASESGEFFGFFSVMSKFSAIFGPLLFAGAVAIFDSSRPAVLGLILFFVIGIWILNKVDVDEGRRVAQEADRRLMGE